MTNFHFFWSAGQCYKNPIHSKTEPFTKFKAIQKEVERSYNKTTHHYSYKSHTKDDNTFLPRVSSIIKHGGADICVFLMCIHLS